MLIDDPLFGIDVSRKGKVVSDNDTMSPPPVNTDKRVNNEVEKVPVHIDKSMFDSVKTVENIVEVNEDIRESKEFEGKEL